MAFFCLSVIVFMYVGYGSCASYLQAWLGFLPMILVASGVMAGETWNTSLPRNLPLIRNLSVESIRIRNEDRMFVPCWDRRVSLSMSCACDMLLPHACHSYHGTMRVCVDGSATCPHSLTMLQSATLLEIVPDDATPMSTGC